MTPAPWTDPIVLDAAVDAACRVRDDNPDDLRAELAKIPRWTLHELVLVLAAMVDVDKPLGALQRWRHDDFVRSAGDDDPPDRTVHCQRGHALVAGNVYSNGRGRWRCRECTRNHQQSRQREAS